jgi:hypothetical protein
MTSQAAFCVAIITVGNHPFLQSLPIFEKNYVYSHIHRRVKLISFQAI